MSTDEVNELVDNKLSSLGNLLGKAFLERGDFKRRIEELEKRVKALEEEKEDLKHQVENQSLNIAHLENDATRTEQENERRLFKLEIGRIDVKESVEEDSMKPNLKNQRKLTANNDEDWKDGFGHFQGNDASTKRRYHDKSAVSRVLKAMEAGQREFNLKETDHRYTYYILIMNYYRSRTKFYSRTNLEVREGGWYIRHQTFQKDKGGDGHWKLVLTYKGTYTCLAYNDHGEVSCDAQVMVREPK
uniref:Uncharacterized protein n=1 Tax=Oikopleura dioica TaxID=34765 RepID=Q676A2_OIKDI|nr:hypothetical protein 003-25 [Oikopleura dioica]